MPEETVLVSAISALVISKISAIYPEIAFLLLIVLIVSIIVQHRQKLVGSQWNFRCTSSGIVLGSMICPISFCTIMVHTNNLSNELSELIFLCLMCSLVALTNLAMSCSLHHYSCSNPMHFAVTFVLVVSMYRYFLPQARLSCVILVLLSFLLVSAYFTHSLPRSFTQGELLVVVTIISIVASNCILILMWKLTLWYVTDIIIYSSNRTYLISQAFGFSTLLLCGVFLPPFLQKQYNRSKKRRILNGFQPTLVNDSTPDDVHIFLMHTDVVLSYIAFFVCIVFFIYPHFFIILDKHDPFIWLFTYLADTRSTYQKSLSPLVWARSFLNLPINIPIRLVILLYWGILLGLGVFVFAPAGSAPQSSAVALSSESKPLSQALPSKSSQSKLLSQELPSTVSPAKNLFPNIVARKYYHLLVFLLLAPAIILEFEMTCLSMTLALSVFFLLEPIRISHLPPFGPLIDSHLRTYVDERDIGILILTHIYLLFGCSAPCFLHCITFHYNLNNQFTFLPALSGILVLGIADSVASIAGTYFGKHHWYFPLAKRTSKKSIEGTICAIISLLLAIFLTQTTFSLIFSPIPPILNASSLFGIIFASVLVCLLEAVTKQIDNLFLPLYYYSLLLLLND